MMLPVNRLRDLEDFRWGREDALVNYYSPDQRSTAYRRGYLEGLNIRLQHMIRENNESTSHE